MDGVEYEAPLVAWGNPLRTMTAKRRRAVICLESAYYSLYILKTNSSSQLFHHHARDCGSSCAVAAELQTQVNIDQSHY